MDKDTYYLFPLTRLLDKSVYNIPVHPELLVEKAAERQSLSKKRPGPIGLLRSNLVQQEVTPMNINSLSSLAKLMEVKLEVLRMLGALLKRDVTRDDSE